MTETVQLPWARGYYYGIARYVFQDAVSPYILEQDDKDAFDYGIYRGFIG